MSFKFEEISELIKSRLDKLNNIDYYYEGKIISIIDGIIRITGLSNVFLNEILELPNNLGYALIFDLDRDFISAISLSSYNKLKPGMIIKSTGNILKIPVGSCLLGRVLDSLGRPIDGKGDLNCSNFYPIERDSPSIIDRRYINRPLCTGYKAIDSMIPIGLGQRELIIGDRKTGKTSLVIDIIINQKKLNVKCIYVSIGQKLSSVFNIIQKLKYFKALDHTIFIVSTSSDEAIMQYIAPYSGCSIAEYFRDNGEDALIIYDDLSKHAISYRQISLLLKRTPGREAYPGDVFYLHSRLLERSAYVNYKFIRKFNSKYNINNITGSLTSLPIVETYEGDISSLIATNIISITDGQIFLESDLFNSGIKPAINPGISVSRVGSSAQTCIMKYLSSSLRTSLSQYYELLNFSQFSSNLDSNTIKILNYGSKLIEILKQKQYNPYSLYKQILILFSLKYGYLDDINIDKISLYEERLYNYACLKNIKLKNNINMLGIINKKIINILKNIVTSFKSEFII